MKYNIKNRTIHVWLPKKLFKQLEEKIEERKANNTQPVLQLAQAAYLLNLVIYIPSKKKDEYEDGWVPICSKANDSIRNFSKYMEFLVEGNLLLRHEKNYSNLQHYCYTYRLPDPYHKQRIRPIEVKGNKLFIEKREEERNKRMEVAGTTTGHLTKWLDPERFEIDKEAAKTSVRENFPLAINNHKYNQRIINIETLSQGGWGYSREGKDDRLHSPLTSLPKDLKPFVRYDACPLISIDIKNSQPYIFSSVLLNLNTTNENLIHNTLYKHNLIPNMFDAFYGPNTNGDLGRFIELVEKGKFYEHFGEILYKSGVVFNDCCGTFSYESSTKFGTKLKKFESLRDVSKDIIMLNFFGKGGSNGSRTKKIFEGEFKTAFGIMQEIKKSNAKEKNFFPILLQNIEAACILDHCTKEISLEHPDIPLFTIHDSIVTTEDNIETVEEAFKRHLKTYFGTIPRLKREPWCLSTKPEDKFVDQEYTSS